MQRPRSTTRTRALAVAVAFTTLVGLGLTSSAHADTDAPRLPLEYVALGDSAVAGPSIAPSDPLAPANCGRSLANYPHLAADELGLTLVDRSCTAAKVSNMTSAQFADQPPQFDGLTSETAVVTLTIGGNDNDTYLKAVLLCGAIDSLVVLDVGAPCKAIFGSSFSESIAADAVNVAGALQEIHRRSPQAKVFVVGYPAFLPESGACRPQVPLTTKDVAYVSGIMRELNAMLAASAATNGATFVDTYTPSIGHDMCQDAATRWVEPYVVPQGVQSAHPNAAGHQATAAVVAAAMRNAGV